MASSACSSALRRRPLGSKRAPSIISACVTALTKKASAGCEAIQLSTFESGCARNFRQNVGVKKNAHARRFLGVEIFNGAAGSKLGGARTGSRAATFKATSPRPTKRARMRVAKSAAGAGDSRSAARRICLTSSSIERLRLAARTRRLRFSDSSKSRTVSVANDASEGQGSFGAPLPLFAPA